MHICLYIHVYWLPHNPHAQIPIRMNIHETSCVLFHIYAHVNTCIKMQAPLQNIEHGKCDTKILGSACPQLTPPRRADGCTACKAHLSSRTCHAMCGVQIHLAGALPGAMVGVQEHSSRFLRLALYVCVLYPSCTCCIQKEPAHKSGKTQAAADTLTVCVALFY